MSALSAFRDGVRRVNRAPHLVAGMFLVTLAIALPLSLALRGMIEAHLGPSLEAESAASGVNGDWWQEFSAQATGLGTTFVPSLIGFGAVLDNLSGFMDNQPLAATIAGVTVAWMVIWSFLSGGVLDRFARNRPTRTAGFFAACGTHFWRFVRLGILGWLAYALLFHAIHPLIFEEGYPRLIRDVTVERRALALRLGAYALFGGVLLFFTMLFDFARVRIVVEDRRSALGALLASVRFVRRNGARVVALYLLNGAAFAVLIAAYAVATPGAPRSGLHMAAVLLLGQVYILARHYLKLLFDFARVRIVVEDRRSALGALLASVRFVRRNGGRIVALYLLNGAAFAVLIAAYAAAAPGAPRSGLHMAAVLLLGQVYILARHYLKLLFYASETALFQRALAHAEYTAAPVVVWPDSPAVEAITNAGPPASGR